MELRPARTSESLARQAGALVLAAFLVVGCATTGNQAGPSGSSGTSDSPGPSGSSGTSGSPGSSAAESSASPSGSGFYMRIWQTQALPPQNAFAQLPLVTIDDGQFIDGLVAVPAIYPGPLWIGPSVRSISAAGIALIVYQARAAGLLGSTRDFTDGGLAGAITGHIQIVVDGVTYDLTGPVSMPDGVPATAGTTAAFEEFWQKMGGTIDWLDPSLGPSASYEPTRLAVLAIPPAEASSGINPTETAWPLSAPFSSFGTAYGSAGSRCMVVSGADLIRLIPVVKQSNQLTRFVDAQGVKDSLQVRVLVPGEPGPCD
jgi:hypothetical protein